MKRPYSRGKIAPNYAYSLDKGKGYHRAEELIDALFDLLLWAIDKGHIDLTK